MGHCVEMGLYSFYGKNEASDTNGVIGTATNKKVSKLICRKTMKETKPNSSIKPYQPLWEYEGLNFHNAHPFLDDHYINIAIRQSNYSGSWGMAKRNQS